VRLRPISNLPLARSAVISTTAAGTRNVEFDFRQLGAGCQPQVVPGFFQHYPPTSAVVVHALTARKRTCTSGITEGAPVAESAEDGRRTDQVLLVRSHTRTISASPV
jgi:hypothetical protein